jgi:hypothetical protein
MTLQTPASRDNLKSSRFKSGLFATALWLLSVYLGLWLVEAMARITFHGALFVPGNATHGLIPHKTRYAALEPDVTIGMAELPFWTSARINARGIRGPEIDQHPAPGIFRILMLSDSNSFGSGVGDDETLPYQLQKQLGQRFEVINFSVPAYSTVQQYIWLTEDGLALKPDLVLLGFTPINDIQTNYQPLQARYQRNSRRPYALSDGAGGFRIDNSFMDTFVGKNPGPKLWRRMLNATIGPMVQKLALQAYAMVTESKRSDPNIWLGWPYLTQFQDRGTDGGLDNKAYAMLWQDAWAVTTAVITGIKEKSEASGARFAMFSHVAKLEGDPVFRKEVEAAYPGLAIDAFKAERELTAFGKATGIAVASYATAIHQASADASRASLYFSMGDEHMTPDGTAIAAKQLATDLILKGIVPKD